jgi:radical SAM protein with 4Fe4S-binding SPASM domain
MATILLRLLKRYRKEKHDTMPFRSQVDDSAPLWLQVELTSHCNLKCQMCPLTLGISSTATNPGHISELTWNQVVEQAKKIGRVQLTGYGEPFSNPRFLDYLEELDRLGIETAFSTNGIGATEAKAKRLGALKHLAQVNVSIDSPDPATYLKIRGERVERALLGAQRIRSSCPKIIMTVSAVAMNTNLSSLVSFPAVLKKLNIDKFTVQGMIEWSTSLSQEQILNADEVKLCLAYFNEIRKECETHGIELHFHPPIRLDLEVLDPDLARNLYHDRHPKSGFTRQCTIPWDSVFVDKNGEILPCCYSDSKHVLGDLNKDSFSEIWNGDSYRQFRDRLVTGHNLPDICRRCTNAPIGIHPYSEYSASIRQIRKRGILSNKIQIKVLNTGRREWTQKTSLNIGTSAPRDRTSRLWHPGWSSINRAGTFSETVVQPGQQATFTFPIKYLNQRHPEKQLGGEIFQLVIEGKYWLPKTSFEV